MPPPIDSEALADFMPGDNKTSVRTFVIVAMALAGLAGLFSLLWAFAIMSRAALAMVLWANLAMTLAVVVVALGVVPNWILHAWHGSRLSRSGRTFAFVTLAVLALQ